MAQENDSKYFIKVSRETRSWFTPRTCSFYLPVWKDGTHLWSMLDVEDMTTVWGFESEAEAWAAIDAQIERDRTVTGDP